MLTNKKTGIRILALILALMMSVAIFAGCNSTDADARAEAEAAKAAADKAAAEAAAAKTAAEEAAKKLQEQLDKALADAAAAQAAADKAQADANKAQNTADGYHEGDSNKSDPVVDKDFNDLTSEIKKDALQKFETLKNQYLVYQKTWYTSANYAKLQSIFEDASYELYRATTSKDVEKILNDATTKAAAVDNVLSDAAAVQALVAALGDITKTVTLDINGNCAAVDAARAAFNAWVDKYATCFFVANGVPSTLISTANGKTVANIEGNEESLVSFAAAVIKAQTGKDQLAINLRTTSNGMLYAEDVVDALRVGATNTMQAILVAYLKANNFVNRGTGMTEAEFVKLLYNDDAQAATAVKSALTTFGYIAETAQRYGASYGDCKANAAIIEDAYLQYRLFFNANGGSDAVLHKDFNTINVNITAAQFVKAYVMCLYDGELDEFKAAASAFLKNDVVNFFLNDGTANSITAVAPDALKIADNYTLKTATSEIAALTNYMNVAILDDGIYVGDVSNPTLKIDSSMKTGFTIDLERAAMVSITNLYSYTYSKDFKGTKTLDEAYGIVEQELVKAFATMTQAYYDKVVTLVAESMNDIYNLYLDQKSAAPKTVYGDVTYDATTIATAKAAMDAALKAVQSVKVPTYEELEASKKISEKKLVEVVKVNSAIDHVNFTVAGSSIEAITTAYKAAVDNAFKAYFAAEELVEETFAFIDFKWEVISEVKKAAGYPQKAYADADHQKILNGKTSVKYGFEFKKYFDSAVAIDSSIKVANYATAVKTAADKVVATIQAMNYVDANGAPVYADAVETYSIKWNLSTGESSTTAIAYSVMQPRLTVAAEAVLNTAIAEVNTKIVNAFANLARTKIQSNVGDAIALYKNQYSFDKLDVVGVNLKNDMTEMVDFINYQTMLYSADAASAFEAKYDESLFAVDTLPMVYTSVKYVKQASGTPAAMSNVVVTSSKITAEAVDATYALTLTYTVDGADVGAGAKAAAGYTNKVKYNVPVIENYTHGSFKVTGASGIFTKEKELMAQDLNNMIDLGKTVKISDNAVSKEIAGGNVYNLLDAAAKLLYKKDMLLNSNGVEVKDAATGVVSTVYKPVTLVTTTDVKPVNEIYAQFIDPLDATYGFDTANQRTALYLKRVAETKDRATSFIADINLINSGVTVGDIAGTTKKAEQRILDIMNALTVTTPSYKLATEDTFKGLCADDYSFAIAHARFITYTYTWVVYEGSVQPQD